MLHSVSHSDSGISRNVSSSSAQMPGMGWKGRNTFITPCTPPNSSLIPQAYLLQACPYSQNTFLQRSSLSTVLSLWVCPATPPPIALSHPIWAPVSHHPQSSSPTLLLLFWIPLFAKQLWGKSKEFHFSGDQMFIFGKGVFENMQMFPVVLAKTSHPQELDSLYLPTRRKALWCSDSFWRQYEQNYLLGYIHSDFCFSNLIPLWLDHHIPKIRINHLSITFCLNY